MSENGSINALKRIWPDECDHSACFMTVHGLVYCPTCELTEDPAVAVREVWEVRRRAAADNASMVVLREALDTIQQMAEDDIRRGRTAYQSSIHQIEANARAALIGTLRKGVPAITTPITGPERGR